MSVRAESPGDIPRGWMWNNVRRAFPIPEGETEKKYLWRGKWCCEPPKVFGDGCGDARLLVTVPTLVRSENHGRFTELPSGLPQALAQLRKSSPSLAVFVCVVAQDLPGNAWRFRVLEDLERSWKQSGTGREIALGGIAPDPASRIRALNASIALQEFKGQRSFSRPASRFSRRQSPNAPGKGLNSSFGCIGTNFWNNVR